MHDMVERYGEVCDQTFAAQLLGVNRRTIYRMIHEGRLRGVGRRVDIRSIAEYIENPDLINAQVRAAQQSTGDAHVSREDFLNAARRVHWNNRPTGQ